MSFLWDSAKPQSTTVHDWSAGTGTFDRVDAGWTTGTAGTPGAPPNGTHWVGNVNPSSEQYLLALSGSLSANFTRGDILYQPIYCPSDGPAEVYFANQDTSPSNQYEARLWPDVGWRIRKNVSGTDSDLYDENQPMEATGAMDQWLDTFLWWEPDIADYGELRNTDAGSTGDMLLEAYKQNGTPVFSRFGNFADTTYTAGGLGYAVGGTNTAYFGNPEIAESPDAFENFVPDRRAQDNTDPTGHIDSFNQNGDVFVWDGSRTNFRYDASTFSTPPSGNEYYIRCDNPGAQTETFTDPNEPAPQRYDPPRYLAPGTRAKVEMASNTDGNFQGVYVCTPDPNNTNAVRFELQYGSNAIRVLEFVAGSPTTKWNPTVTLGANTWYVARFDRTTTGELTMSLENAAGTTLAGPNTITLHANTSGSGTGGVGLVAADLGAQHAWSEFRRY